MKKRFFFTILFASLIGAGLNAQVLFHKGLHALKKVTFTENFKSETWNWDTIVAFDTVGNMTYRIIQTLDNYHQVQSQVYEILQNNVWEFNSRGLFYYDGNGNNTIEIWQVWQNNTWINNRKNSFSYNENGDLAVWLDQIWQDTEWVNNGLVNYSYNNSGYLIIYTISDWGNGLWENYSKDTLAYDNNGNLSVRINFEWQNNTWLEIFKNTLFYDNNQQLILSQFEVWSDETWVFSSRSTFYYDFTGHLFNELYESWQNNSWINVFRFTSIYDEATNLITYLGEEWQNDTWQNSNKRTYTYDSNHNSLTGSYQIWQDNSWESWTEFLDFFCSGIKQDYVYGTHYEAHFFSYITNIKEYGAEAEYRIYPNPAKDQFFIDFNESLPCDIEIFNIQGDRVQFCIVVQSGSQIVIENLKSGVYFIKITNKDNVFVTKLLKH